MKKFFCSNSQYLLLACVFGLGIVATRAGAATDPHATKGTAVTGGAGATDTTGTTTATTGGPGGGTDEFYKVVKEHAPDCMSGASFTVGEKGKKGKPSNKISPMSKGYFLGMMLNFAQNVCATNNKDKADAYSKTLTTPKGAGVPLDTLSWIETPNADPLIQNYSILLSLGMLESDGKFDEGRDRHAQHKKDDEIEAGLFQVSSNSVNREQVPGSVYKALLAKYDNGNSNACLGSVFKIGTRPSDNSENFGTDPTSLAFQTVMKKCPALAADYMALLLRKDHRHNGPLDRKEAQPNPECVKVLNDVKKYADNHCDQLAKLVADLPATADRDFKVAVGKERDLGNFAGRKTNGRAYEQAIERENELKKAGSSDAAAATKQREALEKADPKLKAERLESLKASAKVRDGQIKETDTALGEAKKTLDEKKAEFEKHNKPGDPQAEKTKAEFDEAQKTFDKLTKQSATLKDQAKKEKAEIEALQKEVPATAAAEPKSEVQQPKTKEEFSTAITAIDARITALRQKGIKDDNPELAPLLVRAKQLRADLKKLTDSPEPAPAK